ncbi:hypothetical protein N7449_005049 [Penicillium cf. viridicatum]|uniref:Uncharacterized protein n=1 Tax=Penicillium cf. viridicatum TaxID=2972119 RepID=A0A9W9SYY9_9EURO|nr:hypothetical protein N7449_005049 [Penicillium cf. viridicatum]
MDGTDPHNGEISSGVAETIDLHDTLEPALPVQDLESIHEQPSISMASTDVHDMIQPLLPPQAFTLSNGQSQCNVITGLNHMFQPAQPAQGYDLIHGQASIEMANTDVHDMIQPLLPPQAFTPSNGQSQCNVITGLNHMFQPAQPAQGYDSIHGQASIEMANTDVHDMIQPILPPQAFTSSNAQSQHNVITGLNHMFQPAQPAQGYDSIYGQASIEMANTDVHDMIQPILSPQDFVSSNTQQPQRNDLEMDKLHHMFPLTLRVQASDPVESQTPKRSRFIAPTITETQSMYVQDHPYSPFTPVFAI